MSTDLEAILRQVAAGELTPDQALHQLNDAAATTPTDEVLGNSDEPVTSIRLKSSYRSVQVIADPSVAQLHVLGDHSIRHDGSILQVTTSGPLDDDERAAGANQPDTQSSGRFSFSNLPRTIAWARSWRDHQLTVRVNPALAVELDLIGADVKLTGFTSGLRAHLVASSLKADKLRCEFDLEAFSSSIKLTAIPTGNSRLYCESSSVRLSLPEGADLKIMATNRLGRLVLPERPTSTLPLEGESSEVTIGDGRDRLKLEAVMSSVAVHAQAWGAGPA